VPRRERPRRSTAAQAADPITLVVALDDKHTATGSLYMDDGSSFAFTQGHYLHQNYTWASNKLSATAQKQPEGVPASNGYDNDVVIEKIVVLGLPEGSYVAKVAGQEALLEVFKGAVSMRVANSAGGAHVIRRPNVPVGKDWSITLTKAAAQQ
jgi:alpha 1,3-glucosidase